MSLLRVSPPILNIKPAASLLTIRDAADDEVDLAQHRFSRAGAGCPGGVAAGPANDTFFTAGCLGRCAGLAGIGTASAASRKIRPDDHRLAAAPSGTQARQVAGQRT